jgi:hypothetical protein
MTSLFQFKGSEFEGSEFEGYEFEGAELCKKMASKNALC